MPSELVEWDGVRLLDEARSWEVVEGRPRRAGVSSFGISGTNAHVILEEPAPPQETEPREEERERPAVPVPLFVSGRDETALQALAGRLHTYLTDHPDLSPVDLGWSLATMRTTLEHRAAVIGTDRTDLLTGLDALAHGVDSPGVVRDDGAVPRGKTAFLFPGQGSQRPGTGRELYERMPAFARALDDVCALLDGELPRPLADVLFAPEGSPEAALLDRTDVAQAALFATGVALFRLLESRGTVPDLLLGHSIGEITAAHVAGVFSLEDACALVATRGGLMRSARGDGAMIALQATEDEVRETLERYETGGGAAVVVAAVNGPRSIVVSGDEPAVEELAALWRARGRGSKRLRVGHAFHSPHMDGVLDAFRAAAERLTFHESRIPVVSNVTGAIATAAQLRSPDYWTRHIRETVRFQDGVRRLEAEGVTDYLELGPGAVLGALVRECLTGGPGAILPLLRTGRPEAAGVTSALALLRLRGGALDPDTTFPGGGRVDDLPTYPFRRDRYWLTASPAAGDAQGLGLRATAHPFLGAAVPVAGRDIHMLTGYLSLDTHPWLAGHSVHGAVVFPGSGFLDLALRAGAAVGLGRVEELTLTSPLVLPVGKGVRLQATVGEADGSGARPFELYACPDAGEDGEPPPWTPHARGRLTAAGGVEALETPWPPVEADEIELDGVYDRLADAGFGYGRGFAGLRRVWRTEDEICAEVALDEEETGGGHGFVLHPALLDAALHPLLPAVAGVEGPARLPFTWGGVEVGAVVTTALRVRLKLTGPGRASVRLADATGAPVASMESLELLPVGEEVISGADGGGLFGVVWE
ncbi:acyltransferase domain-containing protein, partial [Streptomyces sp. NPDC058953]|uniref:acyltransferase domain-containing protein n=1 Tax=Streptomyces sp. NPDC058953 TaxID=3346676 RepID=UPI0036895E00